MTRVLNEILLLSCMAVFVTGIVVAAVELPPFNRTQGYCD